MTGSPAERLLSLAACPAIRDGLSFLLSRDPVFSKRYTCPPEGFAWPYMGPGLSTLVRIVLGQQISVKAANALWVRFSEAMTDERGALRFEGDSQSSLFSDFTGLGISRQKTETIKGLVAAIEKGLLDVDALTTAPDQTVYDSLTAQKGLGRWSAEMYLIFGLARPDIWPAADLGIQEAMRRYLGSEERPTAQAILPEGERFAPYRTAASLLLWHMKGA